MMINSNEEIKYTRQYIDGTTEKILQDIETTFFSQKHKSQVSIDSLDICHIFGYIDKLKSREETAKKILQSDAYYKDIYKALCNLFEVDEFKYQIDNEELKKILKDGGFCV